MSFIHFKLSWEIVLMNDISRQVMAATIARLALRPALRSLPARLSSSLPVLQARVSSPPHLLCQVKIPSEVQSRAYSGKDPLNLQYIQER